MQGLHQVMAGGCNEAPLRTRCLLRHLIGDRQRVIGTPQLVGALINELLKLLVASSQHRGRHADVGYIIQNDQVVPIHQRATGQPQTSSAS